LALMLLARGALLLTRLVLVPIIVLRTVRHY
jgi:hypothetical protein